MIPTTEKMLTGNWVCQAAKQNRKKVFGPEMTSRHLAGSMDQGSRIQNRGSLDPDDWRQLAGSASSTFTNHGGREPSPAPGRRTDSTTSGDLSPNNWSMIIEQWTGGQINQLEKKYQKLVHNRCARCNLCNLSNTWHFYNTIAILISQNISKCRGHYRHFSKSCSVEIIRGLSECLDFFLKKKEILNFSLCDSI